MSAFYGSSALLPGNSQRYSSGASSLTQSIEDGGHSEILHLRQKIALLITTFEEYKSETTAAMNTTDSELKQCHLDIANLQQRLVEIESTTESQPAVSRTRRKVPRELASVIKRLHDAAPTSSKFSGAELFSSNVNQKAKDNLLTHLKTKYCKTVFSPKRLNVSVHRYYESRRRLFNDTQPGRAEKAEVMKKETRKRSLRKKLYTDRTKVLKTEAERELWQSIDFNYMTEESDCDEDGELAIRRYLLPWRSKKLNRLVRRLTKRMPKTRYFKPREDAAEPSEIPPPSDASSWTLGIITEDNEGAVADGNTQLDSTQQNSDVESSSDEDGSLSDSQSVESSNTSSQSQDNLGFDVQLPVSTPVRNDLVTSRSTGVSRVQPTARTPPLDELNSGQVRIRPPARTPVQNSLEARTPMQDHFNAAVYAVLGGTPSSSRSYHSHPGEGSTKSSYSGLKRKSTSRSRKQLKL